MGHRREFLEHCARRELAYPVDSAGRPLWRPSARAAEWRVSVGAGAVYSTTTVRRRGEEPYDVSLIELDEGFRMMACVEGVAPEDVAIGMRVAVAWRDGEPPLPVFRPVEGA